MSTWRTPEGLSPSERRLIENFRAGKTLVVYGNATVVQINQTPEQALTLARCIIDGARAAITLLEKTPLQ